jgi:Zn-finger nucleic acid-binding protein
MTQAPMTCPLDGTMLVMSERQGVEIDYCPSCRGVWLDRGELDKILERSAAELAPAAPPHRDGAGDWRDRGYGHDYRRRKRKKSFLEELFD